MVSICHFANGLQHIDEMTRTDSNEAHAIFITSCVFLF